MDVVRYLMSDPMPAARKRLAIHGAVAWFKKYALTGIDMVKVEAMHYSSTSRLKRAVSLPFGQASTMQSVYYPLRLDPLN